MLTAMKRRSTNLSDAQREDGGANLREENSEAVLELWFPTVDTS